MEINYFNDHLTFFEVLSASVSIVTPLILFIWFLYSQYQSYFKTYCKELEGIYAGFVPSTRPLSESKGINAGIILYVRDVDTKGFFKGEFEFGEARLSLQNMIPVHSLVSIGIHTFLGKLKFEIYRDRIRHPLKPKENRIYNGTLYVIDRFDFAFDTNKMEDYLQAEYRIIHYREMKTLKFSLSKIYKEVAQKLPTEFTLYKSSNFAFEPLKGVRDVIFRPLEENGKI